MFSLKNNGFWIPEYPVPCPLFDTITFLDFQTSRTGIPAIGLLGSSCAAGLLSDEKEFFIEINPEEEYSIFGFWYEDEEINSILERITFSVDKNEAWYSSTPTIEDGSIFFYFKDADQNKLDVIYEQIKTGNKMYHWNDNKKLIAEFDLSGAISSIKILKTWV